MYNPRVGMKKAVNAARTDVLYNSPVNSLEDSKPLPTHSLLSVRIAVTDDLDLFAEEPDRTDGQLDAAALTSLQHDLDVLRGQGHLSPDHLLGYLYARLGLDSPPGVLKLTKSMETFANAALAHERGRGESTVTYLQETWSQATAALAVVPKWNSRRTLWDRSSQGLVLHDGIYVAPLGRVLNKRFDPVLVVFEMPHDDDDDDDQDDEQDSETGTRAKALLDDADSLSQLLGSTPWSKLLLGPHVTIKDIVEAVEPEKRPELAVLHARGTVYAKSFVYGFVNRAFGLGEMAWIRQEERERVEANGVDAEELEEQVGGRPRADCCFWLLLCSQANEPYFLPARRSAATKTIAQGTPTCGCKPRVHPGAG